MSPVIHGISLHVDEGEIVAILGSNGAGKSTTMRTIAGLMHPESGSISFCGEDISKKPAFEIMQARNQLRPRGAQALRKA